MIADPEPQTVTVAAVPGSVAVMIAVPEPQTAIAAANGSRMSIKPGTPPTARL
ncbi:MAG: hypothetical protein ACR2GH_06355 [Pseudonocardia sp.]